MTCCMAFTSAPELEGHQGAQHDRAAQNLPRGHEFAEQRRAEDGREQWLEIHDQRAAKRPDAVDRDEQREHRDGNGDAHHHQREPAGASLRGMPVPGGEREDDED